MGNSISVRLWRRTNLRVGSRRSQVPKVLRPVITAWMRWVFDWGLQHIIQSQGCTLEFDFAFLHQGVKGLGWMAPFCPLKENVNKGDIFVLQIAQLAHEAVAVARILCSNADKRSEKTASYPHNSSTPASHLEPEIEQPRPKSPPKRPKLPPTRPKSTPPETEQQLSRPMSPLLLIW